MVMLVLVIVMMMVMMFFPILLVQPFQFQLGKLRRQSGLSLHGGDQLLAGKLIPRSGDQRGHLIVFPDHGDGRVQLGLWNGIRAGENNGGRSFNLVIVELAEVLHIHLDLARIGYGHRIAQRNLVICHLLHGGNHIGQLAHARRLNDNPVGMIRGNDLLQRLAKITHQAAADTAGVHLSNVDAGIFQKTAVNANLTELILDQYQLLALIRFRNHLLDQRSFASAKKAGEYVNFCHINAPSVQNFYLLLYHISRAVTSQKTFGFRQYSLGFAAIVLLCCQ